MEVLTLIFFHLKLWRKQSEEPMLRSSNNLFYLTNIPKCKDIRFAFQNFQFVKAKSSLSEKNHEQSRDQVSCKQISGSGKLIWKRK